MAFSSLKRSRLSRRSAMGRTARLMRRKMMARQGKKVRQWARVRRQLKEQFAALGIVRCEVCGTDENLGFAHSRKRRNITTDEEMREVALLCNRDHDSLELLGEEKMRPAIEAIIAARPGRALEAI